MNNTKTLIFFLKFILPFLIVIPLCWQLVSVVGPDFYKYPIGPGSTIPLSVYLEEKSIPEISSSNNELLAGQKVTGQFKASQDNLGIILIRFDTFNRINNDTVVFRIKFADQDSWFYQSDYLVDQFQHRAYFTFGFPIISDSKNKLFAWEIESKKGQIGDGVRVMTVDNFAEAYRLNLRSPDNLIKGIFNRISLVRNQNRFTNEVYYSIFWTVIALITNLLIVRFRNILYKRLISPLWSLLNVVDKAQLSFRELMRLPIEKVFPSFWSRLSNKPIFKKVVTSSYWCWFYRHSLVIIIGFIVVCGVVYRSDFLLDVSRPDNVFYYTLGGASDSDMLLRYATEYSRGVINPRIAVAHDYILAIPFLALIVGNLNFIDSLIVISVILVLVSSSVLIWLSSIWNRISQWSIGGLFLVSLLATNSFLSGASVKVILDTFTSLFYCIVLALIILVEKYRKYWLILVLSGALLLNTFHRPPFGMNDLLFCMAFAAVFICRSIFNRDFKWSMLIKYLTPLIIFIFIYGSWELYHYWRFGIPYALGNVVFALFDWHPKVVDSHSIMYRGEAEHFQHGLAVYPDTILNRLEKYLVLIFSFSKVLFDRLEIPGWLILLMVPIMTYRLKKSIIDNLVVMIKNWCIFGLLVWLIGFGISQSIYFEGKGWSILEILYMSGLVLVIFYGLALSWSVRLVMMYSLILFILVGLGSKSVSSWRHSIPLIIWMLTVITLSVQSKIDSFNLSKKLTKGLFVVFAFFILIFYSASLFLGLFDLTNNTKNVISEVNYYQKANNIIPQDGIVMSSHENLILLTKNLDRPVIYNSQWLYYQFTPDDHQLKVSDEILLGESKFYVLESSAKVWEAKLRDIYNSKNQNKYRYHLEVFNSLPDGSKIYQLVAQ